MSPESFGQLPSVSQALFRVFRVNHESVAIQLAGEVQRFLCWVASSEENVCAPIGDQDDDRRGRDIPGGEAQGVCQGRSASRGKILTRGQRIGKGLSRLPEHLCGSSPERDDGNFIGPLERAIQKADNGTHYQAHSLLNRVAAA